MKMKAGKTTSKKLADHNQASPLNAWLRQFGLQLFSSVLASLFISINGYAATASETAAAVADLKTVSDAGLVGKRLAQPEPVLQPKPVQGITKPAASASDAIPGAEQIKFILEHVNTENVTAFKPAQIEAFFTPYYHRQISLAELQGLIDKVTNYYRNNGYVLSKAIIPPQKIQNGVVTIRIVEGYINKVTVEGNPRRAKPLIQAFGQQVINQKPLQIKNLERYVLLANDIPGSTVKAVLVPSETAQGGADLNLVADQKIGQAYFSYDNFGTRFLGPQEFTIGGDLYSLLKAGDDWSLRAVTTAQTRELRFLQIGHEQPIGSNGLRWNIGSTYTETQPGSILQNVDIQGRSRSIYTGLRYPIIRSRLENWSVEGSFNYMNSDTTIVSQPFYDDKVRYLHLGTTFDIADQWRGINSAGLSLDKGIGMLGASTGDDDISRPDGRADFTKTIIQLSRLQSLNNRFSLLLASQGQYSFNPLLAAQQFSYGGSDFGRGYDPSEIVGDSGIAAKAELRIDTLPALSLLNAVQYYAFYDIGKIWNIKDVGQTRITSAASTGLGARINFNKYVGANVFLAQPLTRPVANQESVDKNGKAPRGFFQITTFF